MQSAARQENAVEAMIAIIAALTNIRLYPPTSAIVGKSIDKVYPALERILENEADVIFAESENVLLVSGEPLGEKDRKKPQVIAFLELLTNFTIKSLAFEKGVEKDELTALLRIMSQDPDAVQQSGGLHAALEGEHLPHIRLDEKVFVAMDQDQQVIAEMAIKDNEIIKYLTGDKHRSGIDRDQLKEMAGDPAWVAKVFKSGLKHISGERGSVSNRKISEKFGAMLDNLEDISSGEHHEEINQNAAAAMASLDSEAMSIVLSDNLEALLNTGLFATISQTVDDEKFEKLAIKLKFMKERAEKKGTDENSPEYQTIMQAYGQLLDSERGSNLAEAIETEYQRATEEKKDKASAIKDALAGVIRGQRENLLDDQLAKSLPDTIDRLYSLGKNQAAQQIITRLSQALTDEKKDIRTAAANILSVSYDLYAPVAGTEELPEFSQDLLAWIETEPQLSPAFEKICRQFIETAQNLIEAGRHTDAESIRSCIENLAQRAPDRDEKISGLAETLLEELEAFQAEAMKAQLADGEDPAAPGDETAADLEPVQAPAVSIDDQLAAIEEFVSHGEKDKAVQYIFNEIVNAANRKDFTQAEALRDKLFEVDSMALSEIIKAGEIIEQAKGEDRRTHDRYILSGPVQLQMMQAPGKLTGKPFKAVLSDVSVGGLSFILKTSKAETVRLLLGRQLNIMFSLSKETDTEKTERIGTVVAVNNLLENEYSVHVRFSKAIEEDKIKTLKQ